MIVNSVTENGMDKCDLNFLKRKLEEEVSHNPANNGHSNSNGDMNTEVFKQSASGELWKKRHLDTADSCYGIGTFFVTDSEQVELLSAPAASAIEGNNNNSPANNNNNNSNSNTNNNSTTNHNQNSSNNEMSFNLINSASFINDLFGYETNHLVVPVTTCTANVHQTAYATPTSVCYDDGNNWQATDLLELDHRYNSGLQAELSQLQETEPDKTCPPMQQPQSHSHGQHPPQHTQHTQTFESRDNFLVPHKQIERPSHGFRYRSSANEQPAQSDPQTQQCVDADSDFEDKNLSWLLNFKFDELPHLSPDVSSNLAACQTGGSNKSGSNLNAPPNHSLQCNGERARSPKSSSKASKKFEELVLEATSDMEHSDIAASESGTMEESSVRAPKKPPFTYTELIEYALEDKGELTVSGIYQWISDRFPYYKSNDDRWKNSVRHNLSINPHFRKGAKAPQGAGHLWTISSGDSAENVLAWEHKKQRLDLFFKMESINRERLQQHQQQQIQQQRQLQHPCTSPHQSCQADQCLYDESAIAAAAITHEMLQQNQQNHQQHQSHTQPLCPPTPTVLADNQRYTSVNIVHELPFNDLLSDEELRKTAGQILNGIHRDVEVQSVNSIISNYQDVLLENEDYLNPIHKDIIVNESGLRATSMSATAAVSTPATTATSGTFLGQRHANANSQYYITEIDPLELGIQMSHRVEDDDEALFSDDFNLNYFGYTTAGNDIVA